jgi:hypothetical protein
MAKLGIFTGTTPNDGTGDSLLTGAVKINSNFTELYTAFGDGTNLSNGGLNITGVITATSAVRVASAVTITSSGIHAATGFVTATEYDITGTVITLNSQGLNLGVVGVATASAFNGNINATGFSTIANINSTGVITATTFNGRVNATGFSTIANINASGVITAAQFNGDIRSTGVSTFTGTFGPVLIGGGTSTGISSSILQVTGISSSAYIGGFLGVGTATPRNRVDIEGDLRVSGALLNSYYVAYSVAMGM